MKTIAELKQKSKLPAKQAGGSTVAQFFDANKNALAAVLPKHMTPDRMMKIALQAIRSVPQLLECTTESLFGAVVQCAQLGLEPNTTLGQAYLIPFRNKRENRTDVQMIIGYKGLIDLARRSGQIISIAAHAVRENDEFEFAYGLTEKLSHRPAMRDRGEIIAFYAVAQLVGGGHAYEVMSREDVDSIKANSQSRGQWGPWKDHYEEMGRKTAIRRLSKYLPLSIEFSTAVSIDSKSDTDSPPDLSTVLDGSFVVEDPITAPIEDMASPDKTDTDTDPDPGEEHDQTPTEGTDTWPQKLPDENGELRWADVNTRHTGKFYDSDLHAWSHKNEKPAVKSNGSFWARRGTSARPKTERQKASTPPPDTKPGSPGPTEPGTDQGSWE
jgi:recombination protein RecT